MKRLTFTALSSLLLLFLLLFSSCAPTTSMVATLTQLPFAATPATSTPYPTVTPKPTKTPGGKPENTPTKDATAAAALTLTALPTATATPPPACPPFAYDTTIPDPTYPDQFIGMHFDPKNPPLGMKWLDSGPLATDSFSWAHVRARGQDMYWVQSLVCRDAAGTAYWQIADAISFPELNLGAHEVIVDQCYQGDQAVPWTIAYGTYDPSKSPAPVAGNKVGWPVKIQDAWQMLDKFTPLSADSLTCLVPRQ